MRISPTTQMILDALKKAVAQAIAKHEREGRGELVKAAQSKIDDK
jgi:hypothetical protein